MIELILAAALATASKSDAQIEYEALLPIILMKYETCLTLQASKYAKSSEPASVVVDAAFGACLSQRVELAELPKKSGLKVSSGENERQLQWIDERERKQLTSFVLDFRGNH